MFTNRPFYWHNTHYEFEHWMQLPLKLSSWHAHFFAFICHLHYPNQWRERQREREKKHVANLIADWISMAFNSQLYHSKISYNFPLNFQPNYIHLNTFNWHAMLYAWHFNHKINARFARVCTRVHIKNNV